MLSSLHIENIAVIKELDIDFNNGFSVLSGETGAGKSIIIDSINLLLGKKIERELIRKGESSAMVSGLFTNLSDFTLSVLKEAGVSSDEEGNLFIQRSINTEGRSQIRINGRAANIALLKSIGDGLINIHGQDDTRSLVSPASHLQILDKFAANDNLLEEYRVLYREYDRIQKEINAISEKEQERIRYTEILEYQIKDIDTLNLKDGEEEELIDKKAKIKNSERITKHAEHLR